jgi:integrase/recombinase XerD
MNTLAATLQAFFTDRLVSQRKASPHTIAAYRDTIKLLFVFAAERAPASNHPSCGSRIWMRR